MPHDDEQDDDRDLLHEIGRITDEYGALHRRTVRELARSRAELASAHTALGTVAHDLRTPLTTVLGFTELLLDDAGLSTAQRHHCERVRHAARAMTALTEELVEAVTVGGSPLRATPVDMGVVVLHVITRHQLLRPPRGIRVVLDRDESGDAPLVVHGDESKLERLLDNLVSNAVKFSPDDGTVHVRVTGSTRNAEVRIRDDGPGLPTDELETIFSPFHRAPGAASVPGVGLGLTIVRQITEQHGGRVHVESVLGDGATFVVRLPLSAESVETAPWSRRDAG